MVLILLFAEPKEPAKEDGGRETGEDVHIRRGDDPNFEPVIELPDKVETKTGEKGEEVWPTTLFLNSIQMIK